MYNILHFFQYKNENDQNGTFENFVWMENFINLPPTPEGAISCLKGCNGWGLEKPEPLKYNWSGKWSRRIDKENRLIYEMGNDHVKIHLFWGTTKENTFLSISSI